MPSSAPVAPQPTPTVTPRPTINPNYQPTPAPTPAPATTQKPSFFDSFIDSIENVVHKAVSAPVGIQPSIPPVGPPSPVTQEQQMRQAAQDKLNSLATNPIDAVHWNKSNNIISRNVNALTHVTGDALLSVAKFANDHIVKPYITTPISALAIATDPKSSIYKDGFQFSDLTKAWHQGHIVSPFQALASNSLFRNTPFNMAVQPLSNVFNGPDFSKVDVFSNKSIKENYSDNTFGKIFTGTGDTVLQGLAFGGIGKGASLANNVFREAAGNAAKDAPLADVLQKAEQSANDGITYIKSGGAQGKPTNIGNSMVKMANTTSPADVFNEFKTYSNNRALLPFVAKETDPNNILDMILADNGDIAAQARLFDKNRLVPFSAMGGHDAVASKVFISQGSWLPQGDALKTIHDVHIDSIRTVPEHEQFYNAFMDPKTDLPQLFGTGNVPLEGSIARGLTNAAGWVERQVGGHNNVVTRLVSLAGSRMPNWYVSFSNTTPWRAISEIRASFASLDMFRNPDNLITIAPGKTVIAKDGTHVITPGRTITAKEYIKNVESNYLLAPSDIEKYNVLHDIDSNIGIHMAMTKGYYKAGDTEEVINNLKARAQMNHNSLVQNGTGFDLQGNMIKVDPNTQSQLASSIRMFPWDRVEKELSYHQAGLTGKAGLKTEDLLHDAFRKTNEWNTVDFILKPGYIWKQSELEPTIGAMIALGPRYLSENLPSGISNFLTNNSRRIESAIIRTKQFTTGERKAIVNKVAELGQQLDAHLQSHYLLENEHDKMFIQKTKTGKTVEIYGPEVKKAYADSARAVKAAEEEYLTATRQFGERTVGGSIKQPEIPSVANLQRRIDFIKQNSSKILNKGNRDALTKAEFAVRKAKETSSLFASAEAVDGANLAIQNSYKILDEMLGKLGVAQGERADVFGKTVPFKQRVSGPKDTYRIVGTGDNAKWMKMPEVFDQNAVGEALKAEVSNAQTSAMTYANELTTQTRAGIWARHMPTTVTDVTDPHYYNELSIFMNKMYRQDIFIRRILAGETPDQLIAWGKSETGMRYMQQYDAFTPDEITSHVYDGYARINRYLPSKEAQTLLLKQEVLAPQLEKLLSPHINQLVPIQPRDFNYNEVNSGLGNKYTATISHLIDRVSVKGFTAIMRPENPLRYSFVRTLASDINARKATYLASQGKDVSFAQLEALRQSSFIQAAEEMRKIFYTVPQANRAIYATRAITMFPTATFNAFYRYARMAVKYPIRTLGFLHSYNSMFQTFGIDKNGNPVTDVRDTQYLVVPMTKELGMFNGQGIRVSARSLGFILNQPSLSPYATIPVSALVQHMPSADATLRTLLGSNYDTLFPYGTGRTDFRTVMTPSWARDMVASLPSGPIKNLVGWVQSPMAKASYLASVQSLYDYHQVKVSMGIEKTMPSLAQIQKESNNLFQLKAWYEFLAPTPVKIDTTPMSLYQQLYYGLETKYKQLGQDAVLASANAGKEFLATVGPNFPLDQITFTGSSKKANIADTQEGYARVYKDNVDLTKQLVHLDPQNPFVVGLLTADIDVTDANRSAVISQKLGQADATLPDIGGVVALNDLKLSPVQVQAQRENQRTWDKFFAIKAELDTVAQGYKNSLGQPYKSMTSIPAFQAALKKYAIDVLGKENPTWLNQDYQPRQSMDKSFIYAKGLSLITNNEKFMTAQKNVPFWKSAQDFVKFRNLFADAYNAFPTGKQKTAYKNAYVANLFGDAKANPPIEGQIGTYDPKLQRIITMYFTNDNLTGVK